jgi:hypothetical protein
MVNESNVQQTQLTDPTTGMKGVKFGEPFTIDIHLQYKLPYDGIKAERCMPGMRRSLCVAKHSARYAVENSMDHYAGSWPAPVGVCETASGLEVCDGITSAIPVYGRGRVSFLEIEVRY